MFELMKHDRKQMLNWCSYLYVCTVTNSNITLIRLAWQLCHSTATAFIQTDSVFVLASLLLEKDALTDLFCFDKQLISSEYLLTSNALLST